MLGFASQTPRQSAAPCTLDTAGQPTFALLCIPFYKIITGQGKQKATIENIFVKYKGGK